MGYAHDRGIGQRDLKPDNIFCCDESREHVTKVLDFGIAKPTGLDGTSNTDTGAGAFLGTPSYMSPEQCRGLPIDPRSDLWALGAIVYECLVGKRLFSGDVVGDVVVRICTGELPALNSDAVPPGFAVWLAKAMAQDPKDRFQSAAQLFGALSTVLDGATALARKMDSAETISAELAPRSDLAPPSGASSTLAHGSLEKSARRSEGGPKSPLAIAASGLVIFAILVGVILFRSRASVPVSDGGGPRADEPRAAASLAGAPAEAPPDAGVTDAVPHRAQQPPPGTPPLRSGEERPVGERPVQATPSEPATKAPKRSPPRQNTPLEIERLRKKR